MEISKPILGGASRGVVGGDWDAARKLTKEAYKISPEYARQPLCRLWARIARDVAASPEKAAATQGATQDLGCTP